MSLMDETSQYDARIISSFIRSNGKKKKRKNEGASTGKSKDRGGWLMMRVV
jgi:hypothetical protein